MSVHDLDENELVTLLNDLRSEQVRALLAAEPKLAPFAADLDAHHEALKVTSVPAARPPASDPDEGARLDRRAEAAVRALDGLLDAARDLALARGDDGRAQALGAVRAELFEDGLAFLRQSWNAQLGAADRLVERARLASFAHGLELDGASWHDLVGLVASTNEALRAYSRREDPTPPNRGPTLAQARRATQRTLATFLGVLDHALPAGDATAAARREGLLAPFERVLRRRATAAPTQPAAPVPPEPTPA